MPGEGLRKAASLYLLDDNKLGEMGDLFPPDQSRFPFTNNVNLEGYVVTFQDDPQPPNWISAIQYLTNVGGEGLAAQRPGAVILFKYKNKGFIITLGSGWFHIKLSWYVLNFGKLIALNTIPVDQLSGLKLEQVMAGWHQSTEKSPLPTSAKRFGMESDRDLVHLIEGKPAPKYLSIFGAHIKGGDALHFPIDFSNLSNICDHALERYASSDYKNIWPEFNYISVVVSQNLVERLEEKLEEHMGQATNLQNLTLVCPMFKNVNLPMPHSYWIGRKRSKNGSPVTSPYLYIAAWISLLGGRQATVEGSKSTTVHLFDEDNRCFHRVRLFDCICFEITLDGKQYFLSGGVWYEASNKFIDEIEAHLRQIVQAKPGRLQAWDGIEWEGDYNQRCFKGGKGLYLFDAKNISFGGGHSRFEFCDLYDETTRTLYFVKKVSGSSQFSHLAEQVRRTVELVFHPDPSFRSQLAKKVADLYKTINLDWITTRPKPGQLTLCLVSMGLDCQSYPFFAKASLVKLLKELDKAGHSVEFLTV